MEDNIKDSFQRVKQDMDYLKQEIDFLNSELTNTKNSLIEVCEILKKMAENQENQEKPASTQDQEKQTIATHSSTLQHTFKPLKPQNMYISTGNQGVPTDRQTDRQTDRHPFISSKNPQIDQNLPLKNPIENAAEILDSLDSIKKEIRLKFKRLTDQELLVFSTIYQLDEEQGYTDHKELSSRLNLSESSIRDYVGRIIKKGILVDKKRVNNKNIQLSISKNLKKIASLSTILQLRDI